MWILDIQTLVLTDIRQVIYPLGHLLSCRHVWLYLPFSLWQLLNWELMAVPSLSPDLTPLPRSLVLPYPFSFIVTQINQPISDHGNWTICCEFNRICYWWKQASWFIHGMCSQDMPRLAPSCRSEKNWDVKFPETNVLANCLLWHFNWNLLFGKYSCHLNQDFLGLFCFQLVAQLHVGISDVEAAVKSLGQMLPPPLASMELSLI